MSLPIYFSLFLECRFSSSFVVIQVLHPQYPLPNSSDEDGGRNYLWRTIENTNGRNIQRRIWEATEKPTESYQWELWHHNARNEKISECDINDLKASLEHTETVLEQKVANAGKKVEKLQRKLLRYGIIK